MEFVVFDALTGPRVTLDGTLAAARASSTTHAAGGQS
jgi:hypothetical protein